MRYPQTLTTLILAGTLLFPAWSPGWPQSEAAEDAGTQPVPHGC